MQGTSHFHDPLHLPHYFPPPSYSPPLRQLEDLPDRRLTHHYLPTGIFQHQNRETLTRWRATNSQAASTYIWHHRCDSCLLVLLPLTGRFDDGKQVSPLPTVDFKPIASLELVSRRYIRQTTYPVLSFQTIHSSSSQNNNYTTHETISLTSHF